MSVQIRVYYQISYFRFQNFFFELQIKKKQLKHLLNFESHFNIKTSFMVLYSFIVHGQLKKWR